MLARILIGGVLFAAFPALAQVEQSVPRIDVSTDPQVSPIPLTSYMGPPEGYRAETRIRNMADYLEAVVDSRRGVYIRGYSGQWYYARTRDECPRLTRYATLRFHPSPGGDFDRDSTIRADGWRCRVASVTESDGPSRRR